MIWDVTIRGIKETTQGLASNGYNTLEKKKNYFISLLENHPEGIVIYDHGKPHAVFSQIMMFPLIRFIALIQLQAHQTAGFP